MAKKRSAGGKQQQQTAHATAYRTVQICLRKRCSQSRAKRKAFLELLPQQQYQKFLSFLTSSLRDMPSAGAIGFWCLRSIWCGTADTGYRWAGRARYSGCGTGCCRSWLPNVAPAQRGYSNKQLIGICGFSVAVGKHGQMCAMPMQRRNRPPGLRLVH